MIRAQADELLNAYQEVMRTDPALAPQALQASGDVRASVAEALLATGFRRALGEVVATRVAPYRPAITEYGSAIALYKQAYTRAKLNEESAEARQVAGHASVRAFELTAGEGDAVCAWALELSRKAPPITPGTAGKDARIAYLTTTVAPLLEEGLTYKTQALALSATMPLAQNAEVLRRSLDVPLRPVIEELFTLCHERLNTATASASQLAQTFSFGFQGSSTGPLIDDAEQDFAEAAEIAAGLQSALLQLYGQLQQSYLPPTALAYWDSLTVNSYHDYAELCRDFQDNLAVCLNRLNKPKDDSEAALHKRLRAFAGTWRLLRIRRPGPLARVRHRARRGSPVQCPTCRPPRQAGSENLRQSRRATLRQPPQALIIKGEIPIFPLPPAGRDTQHRSRAVLLLVSLPAGGGARGGGSLLCFDSH